MNPAPSDPPVRSRRFPITPGVIWALAVQTFRQCIRRKVLFILLLFVGVLVVGDRVIPVFDPVRRLEVLTLLSLYSISFFGIIVAIFLAATVLPEDRRLSTITTVMTKPVGRLNYLLGRVVGLGLTMGLLLLVMGVVCWGVLRVVGEQAKVKTGRTDILVGKRGIEPTEAFTRVGDRTFPARRLKAQPDKFAIAGDISESLVFTFRSGLSRLRGDNATLEITPFVTSPLDRTAGEVVVENPVSHARKLFEVTLDSGRTARVAFPRALVDPTEGVQLSVRRLERESFVQLAASDVKLMLPSASFEAVWLKALVMKYFGFLLIVTIAVSVSTFLSAWVAVVTAFTAWFFAEAQQVLSDFMRSLTDPEAGFFGADLYQHVHGPVEHVESSWLVIVVNKVFAGALWVVTHVFPNFNVFDASTWLTKWQDVPMSATLWSGAVFLIYGACFLVVGTLIFWRREVSA